MVLYILMWDLPTEKANLTVYANKAHSDWIPTTLSQPGVAEFRSYRNPLESTPQVCIMLEFDTLDNWRRFIESEDYMRIFREIRFIGCTNIATQLWGPSSIAPEPIRPAE